MSGNPFKYGRGEAWFLGIPTFNAITTVLPPNSPSCIAGEDSGQTAEYLAGMYSASANHTGGVNVGLGDGSVTFVSDTVSTTTAGDATAVAARVAQFMEINGSASGQSPFGVWGALGSIDGGESASFP